VFASARPNQRLENKKRERHQVKLKLKETQKRETYSRKITLHCHEVDTVRSGKKKEKKKRKKKISSSWGLKLSQALRLCLHSDLFVLPLMSKG
jgi:hypothetical protein